MSEVLSQSEIDALLSAMSNGDLDASAIQEGLDEPQVRPFDFMRPSKFSKDQLRTIELLHDAFCRSAQTQLSGALRTIVEIEVMTADQVTYGEFVNSMPTPSLITIVTMEPLEGNAVVELNLPIAFSIIDRLVGGPGTHRPRVRELTEIEHALLQGVLETLLRGFSEAWSTVVPARFRRVGRGVDLFERADGDLGVDHGRVELDVAEDHLDVADVAAVLVHEGRHRVPEQVTAANLADVRSRHVVTHQLRC